MATDEVEPRELEHEGLVEGRLEVPIERLERLAFHQAAHADAPIETGGRLAIDLGAQDVLEQGGVARTLAGGPREQLVEGRERMGQAQVRKMSAQALDHHDRVVGRRARAVIRVRFIRFRLGHRRAPWVGDGRLAGRRTRRDRGAG